MACPDTCIDPCDNPPPVDANNETLESSLNNFITSFYGEVTKSVVDDAVVWELPCNLDSGVPGFPRTEGEGLACYFLDLFVDLAAQVASGGILPQLAVRQATTANITLSGEQTIDGVLTSASRVLVKNQTLSKENGIYVSGAGAWTRATDADTAAELALKNYYFVTNGTANAGTGWTITTAPTVLGTDPVVFTQFNSLASYSAGSGLSLAGTVFSIDNSIVMRRAQNLADVADANTALNNLLPSQTGNAGKALVTDGAGTTSWQTVATSDSAAQSKADSAAALGSAANSGNVSQSTLISTATTNASAADSKAVSAALADSTSSSSTTSKDTSQSVLISTATAAASTADSKAVSQSALISTATANASVADSKAVSDSVVISSNLATTGSQNTSQSTLISTADSKAVSVASAGALDSVARSMATSVATVESTDASSALSRSVSQSTLISTATTNASVADSKALSVSVVESTNLSVGSSQNTSQSTLISIAASKGDSAAGNSVDSVARSQVTSTALTESSDTSVASSQNLSQSVLISTATSKADSAAGNSNDSVARSMATSAVTAESSDYSASVSRSTSQSVLISVATINASAADSKAVSDSVVISQNLNTAVAQSTAASQNTSGAASQAVSVSVVVSSNLATTGSQNTSQSVLLSTASLNTSTADSKAVSAGTQDSTSLSTSNSRDTSQSILISTATANASIADSKAVSDSVGMSVTDSKATSLSTGFSAANSQATADSSTISGYVSTLTSSDTSQSVLISTATANASIADSKAVSDSVVISSNLATTGSQNTSQSVLISTATSKADSAAGNSNDSVARSMATSAALTDSTSTSTGTSQNTSQSVLISTADSKAVAASSADSTNLATSNSQNTSQSVLISTATTNASIADSKALSDSVVISSVQQVASSQNTSQSLLISTADSKAVSALTAVINPASIGSSAPGPATVTALNFDTTAHLRTFKSSAHLEVNVKDYGAAGDGSTDDSSAIAAAVAALPSTGAVLYFPGGTYLCNPSTAGLITLASKTGLTIYGDGAGTSVIQSSVPSQVIYATSTCSYVNVFGLTLDGGCTIRTSGQHGLISAANYTTFHDLIVKHSGEYAVYIFDCSTPKVWLVTVDQCFADGIHFSNCTDVMCVDNSVVGADDDCFAFGSCTRVIVSNNVAHARAYGECLATVSYGGFPGPNDYPAAYTFSSSTADGATSGQYRLNNATPSAATYIYIHKTDSNGYDMTLHFAGASVVSGRKIWIQTAASRTTNYQCYTISGAIVDATTYYKIPVTYSSGGGSITNGTAVNVGPATTWGRGLAILGGNDNVSGSSNLIFGTKQDGLYIHAEGGTNPKNILFQGTTVRNACTCSGYSVSIDYADYVSLLGTDVVDPAIDGACIKLSNWNHLLIKGGTLTQKSTPFCRGIWVDEYGGLSGTWYDLVIQDVTINMIGAGANYSIYASPTAAVTMTNITITGVVSNQTASPADYINIAAARVSGRCFVVGNYTFNGNTITAPSGSASLVNTPNYG